MIKYFTVFLLIILVLGLSGCTKEARKVDLPQSTTAKDILPTIENYTSDKDMLGRDVAPTIQAITTAVGASSGSLEAGAAIGTYFSNFTKCTEKKGAAALGHYYQTTDILDHAFVSVGEENATKLIQCAIESAGYQYLMCVTCEKPKTYGLYLIKYSIETNYTKFHIAAVITTKELAESLCAKLAGCTTQDIKTT